MTVRSPATDTASLIDGFFDALEQGSVDGVRNSYASDATIWHNFDQVSMTPDESLAGVRTLFQSFVTRRYVDVRRHPTSTGLVQQHVLRLGTSDGKTIDWPGCIVFEIRDGLISRLDEYVDMATLASAPDNGETHG